MANLLLEKIASQAWSRLALQGDGPGLRARRLRVRTVRFLKVDTEAERELAAQYNIKSIPTLMLFRTGGSHCPASRRNGRTGAPRLADEAALNLHA